MNEEEDVCTASERATKGETCADQMTNSFRANKDDAAILEPSACDAFRACEETALRCMCSVYGCIVSMNCCSKSGIQKYAPKSP